MVFRGVIVGFGRSLDDAVEFEIRHGVDERDVEDFGREAVADDGDVPWVDGEDVAYFSMCCCHISLLYVPQLRAGYTREKFQ